MECDVRFTVLPDRSQPPDEAASRAYLVTDNWNDWFEFNTQYFLYYCDSNKKAHSIGFVKIGQFGMHQEQRQPLIPNDFEQLDDRFFSLGQDDSYYENLNRLSGDVRDDLLRALRDVALDKNLFTRALSEHVTHRSILRSVSRTTVERQFRRMIFGGARLSSYRFNYTAPSSTSSSVATLSLSFDVVPESEPPTNIHVLIGRNGVGKTHLLNLMTRALAEEGAAPEQVGAFTERSASVESADLFANVISVTFSPFDLFEPIRKLQNTASSSIQYSYVGLKRSLTSDADTSIPKPPKTPHDLAGEFAASVSLCLQGARSARWRSALRVLEADPIFSDAAVADLADPMAQDAGVARALFGNMSSGHKIVLLTITRLVESVEERSLVLFDEPEAHLHPPLLSALIRALSDLLINRNGVAIIATHSPVVLQEVPRSCVWKLRRSGSAWAAERPEIETFGENVGVLTREVFGLEVTRSGFHQVLGEAVAEGSSYNEIVNRFDEELGGEAKGIIRALIAARDRGDIH